MGATARLAGFAAALVVVFLVGLGLGRVAAPGTSVTDDGPTTTTLHEGHEAGAP